MGALSGIMELSKYAGNQAGPSDVPSTKFRSYNPSGGVCSKAGTFANLRELKIQGFTPLPYKAFKEIESRVLNIKAVS